MPRRRKSDRTYTQNVTAENDKFRAQSLAAALDEAEDRNTRDTTDIDKFRRDSYRQALREAKQQ